MNHEQFEKQENKLSYLEKINQWIENAVSIKLLTIGLLILILLIPTSMVENIIRERNARQKEAIEEVSRKWGQEQTLRGPVLTVPYIHRNEEKSYTEYAHFLPDQLDYSATLSPKVLHRGIFEVAVYQSQIKVNGQFARPEFKGWKIAPEDVLWEEAFLSFGLNDLRSIRENPQLQWGSENYTFNPGIPVDDILEDGLNTPVKVGAETSAIDFMIELKLNGSEGLSFSPLGKETNVRIASDWPHPNFYGAFLPDQREINEEGFTANWKVLYLNRSIPQRFREKISGLSYSDFGVELQMPVAHYSKSLRSAKYAIIFITMTFFAFFFIQVLKRLKVHPIQYLLIGFAIVLFFVLLVSLSEHIGFEPAYVSASLAVILLISLYTQGMFGRWQLTSVMGSVMLVLYVFLYVLLQSQDYALLMGSIGLFLSLAVVMYMTRNIDWYSLKKKTTVS